MGSKEPQNQIQIDTYQKEGGVRLGAWTSYIWRNDPKHLGFLLARYKFCAKMLAGKFAALEVGCGDGFGIEVVLQSVGFIHGIDIEPIIIEYAKTCYADNMRCSFEVLDITERPVGMFDAAYSLDVIEHIQPAKEEAFIINICRSLKPDGVCIIGTPNKEAQRYSSPTSVEGHINLQEAEGLRRLLLYYFSNAFIFSMNDEVVHTGYYPMAQYLLGMGVGVK